MKLYIIDIKKKQKVEKFLENIESFNSIILSLTPYSSYILEKHNFKFLTFQDIISNNNLREYILNEYTKVNNIFRKHKRYSYLQIKFSKILSYEIYLEHLFQYTENYKTIYITDTKKPTSISKIFSNSESAIYLNKKIKIINILEEDTFFYKQEIFKFKLFMFLKKANKLKVIINIFRRKKLSFGYDNQYFVSYFQKIPKQKVDTTNIDNGFQDFKEEFKMYIKNNVLEKYYLEILDKLQNDLDSAKYIKEINIKPFTFLTTNQEFIKTLVFKDNQIPIIFTQHGNDLYKNMFLTELFILSMDTYFVLNGWAKDYFKKLGSTNILNIGSKNFNQKIEAKKIDYDFLYVIYAGDYVGNGKYLALSDYYDFSIDGNSIFEQHKYLITMFGEKFSDKKFVIKLHPQIILYGLYIPFLEISNKYSNIEITFSKSIHSLVEKSTYIISDYFTSNFLNRDLHFKRDIILINSKTTPIPKEVIKDMTKMFILAENFNDLEMNIRDIEKISKNKVKDKNTVEYYTSSNINDKILEKEFDLLKSKNEIN